MRLRRWEVITTTRYTTRTRRFWRRKKAEWFANLFDGELALRGIAACSSVVRRDHG